MGVGSGDVGLGLNVRRMRNEFLSLFTITYSLRPLGESASVFRRYPGKWQVSLAAKVHPLPVWHITELPRWLPASNLGDTMNALSLQVFLEDSSSPGRYNMIAERQERPTGTMTLLQLLSRPMSEYSPQGRALAHL